MTLFRYAARLDVKPPHAVKGKRMDGFRVVGDPVELARRYSSAGAHELYYSDVVASLYQREPAWDLIAAVSDASDVPLTVAGGLRTVADAERAIAHGADRVAINTAAHGPGGLALLAALADRFGRQAVVLSVEAKWSAAGRYEAMVNAGRDHTGREVGAWIAQCAPWVSEVAITSVDRDGTMGGADPGLRSVVELAGRCGLAVMLGGGIPDPTSAGGPGGPLSGVIIGAAALTWPWETVAPWSLEEVA